MAYFLMPMNEEINILNKPNQKPTEFKGLYSGDLTLYLIDKSNIQNLEDCLRRNDDSDYFIDELHSSYIARYDDNGLRTKYGFYSVLAGDVAGMSMLGISSWKNSRGYTGADTLSHMRGRGIAPMSKPLLFYLAFEILNLNRVETGCLVSNTSSKRSIEKTKGFILEGTLREFGRNVDGHFEDELRYGILKSDWELLYDKSSINVIS